MKLRSRTFSSLRLPHAVTRDIREYSKGSSMLRGGQCKVQM